MCSRCFESLCDEAYAIAGRCDVARKTLVDSLVVKFKEAMQDYFAEVEFRVYRKYKTKMNRKCVYLF